MSICPNCGRELAEGEICTCSMTKEENVNSAPQPVEVTSPVEAAPQPAQEIPTTEPVAQPTESAPQYEYHPQPEYTQADYTQHGYQAVPPQENGYYAPVPPVPPVYYPEMKQPARTDYPMGYKIKKKYIAVILAVSVGVFGIHNFYLGNKNRALAQLLLSTVGAIFTFGISTAAVTVWSFIEGVLLFMENIDADAEGYKIQTFEESLKNAMKD